MNCLNTTEQWAAIKAPITSPAQIVAGAGCGKTHTLASRIARIVHEKLAVESKVWAISFTNASAQELKNRIDSQLGRKSTVKCSTLHKAASQLLRNIAKAFPFKDLTLGESFPIITPQQAKSIMGEIRSKMTSDQFEEIRADELSFNLSISDLLRKISSMKSQGDNPLEADLTVSMTVAEAFLVREYQHYLQSNGFADFDDLILELIETLVKYDDVRGWVQSQIEVICVDEFQDISPVQMHLINLVRGNAHITVVGDDAQSIYSFRGASHKHFQSFAEKHANTQVFHLHYNFRSHNGIFHIANLVKNAQINSLTHSLDTASSTVMPRAITFDRFEDEGTAIAEQINGLIHKGIKPRDIAVLYRANSQGAQLSSALQIAGIDHTAHGLYSFWERKIIKNAIGFLALSEQPNLFSALKSIQNCLAGFGDKSATTVFELLESNPSLDCISAVELVSPNAGASLRFTLEAIQDCKANGLHGAVNFLKNAPSLFNIDAGDWEDVRPLLEQLEGYCESNEIQTANELLEFANISGHNDEAGSGVKLMTIHASKGKEFKVVFIAGATRGMMPFANINEHEMEDEARLFYVALTRAEELLYICHQRGKLTPFLSPYRKGLEDWSESVSDGEFVESYQTKCIEAEAQFSKLQVQRNKMISANEPETKQSKASKAVLAARAARSARAANRTSRFR